MSTELVVVEPPLAEVWDNVQREHEEAEQAATTWLEHAIACGNWLRRAYEMCERGTFQEHCEAMGIASTCRSRYQRASLGAEELRAAGITTMSGVSRYLRGREFPELRARQGGISGRGANVHADEILAEIVRLRGGGMTHAAIAERLGISSSAVHRVCNPDAARQQKKAAAQRERNRKRELRERTRQQELHRALKQAPQAVARLYADVEKLQDRLGAAHSAVTDSQARQELAKMGEDYRRMRDRMPAILGYLYQGDG